MQVVSRPTVPEPRTRLRAFRNNAGTFVAVTDGVLGIVTMAHPRHAHVADLTRDGRPDLLLGPGDTHPNEILLNNGNGRCPRDARGALPPKILGTRSSTVTLDTADFNADGALSPAPVSSSALRAAPNSWSMHAPSKTTGSPRLQLLLTRDDGTFYAATDAPGRLINVAARTQVRTDPATLFVGFVVSGNVPKKFLVRAVGPTLGACEVIVPPALKAAFTSVGTLALATDTSRAAALAIELPPGGYTTTVSSTAHTTGRRPGRSQ